MPLNPWVSPGVPAAAVCVALGYLVGWWAQRGVGGEEDDEDSTDSDDSEAEQQPARRRRGGGGGGAAAPPVEELKMVLVVNDELKMGKGKIGAQCAHAAVGAVERLREQRQVAALRQWERCGQPKICLRAATTLELRQLAAEAGSKGLPTFVVQDAGRTQVAPGSRTVLAIGPAPKSAIDTVTRHLKLL